MQAGLVNGCLLPVESTRVKAEAPKDTLVSSGLERVGPLRQAYQAQAAKLQVLAADPKASAATEAALPPEPEPSSATVPVAQSDSAVAPAPVPGPIPPAAAPSTAGPAGPAAGIVATEDPELVDCGGAEFADSAAPPSSRTGQGGDCRPGWGLRRRQDPKRSWADCMLHGLLGGSWVSLAA